MKKLLAFSAIILFLFNSCLKHKEDIFLADELYGQVDTLSSFHMAIFGGWDFSSLNPYITSMSFFKSKWDSVVDPIRQPYIQWEGNPSKGWFYDSTLSNGRFKIHFLTDNLIDTLVAPYGDYGTYMELPLNKKLVFKPVLEVIDTVGNRNVVTLVLDKRNYMTVSMDTSKRNTWPPNRPSWKEMAKTFNKLLYSLDQQYLFKRHKP